MITNQTIKTDKIKSRDEIKSCFVIRFVRVVICYDLKYQPGIITRH